MNPRRKASNWWFVQKNVRRHDIERLKIPHHDVKYLIFRTESKNGVLFLHGVVELKKIATAKQVMAMIGPFAMYPNSDSFGKLRILEYKKHSDVTEVYNGTAVNEPGSKTWGLIKNGIKGGLKILSDITNTLADKI